MSKKMITIKHMVSGSCFCSAFSNLYKYHGYKYDDAMIFGLSSSIYWGFLTVIESKMYNITLNFSNMMFSLLSNTGLRYKIVSSDTDIEDLNHVERLIDQDYPVALKLHPSLCVPFRGEVSGFLSFAPAHWITVVGYDQQNQMLSYFDNRSFNLKTISYKNFMQGRNMGNGDQNPQRYLYLIDFKSEHLPFEISVKSSLLSTINLNCYTNRIYHIRSSKIGFDIFLSIIKMWTKLLTIEEINTNLLRIKISITGGYSIKGGYRLLFARYLESISSNLQDEGLLSIASIFRESAFLWNDLIKQLDFVMKDEEKLSFNFINNFKSISEEILRLEQSGFKKIERWML